MNRTVWIWALTATCLLIAGPVAADDGGKQDERKRDVEQPLKKALARDFVLKGRIEVPTKKLVASSLPGPAKTLPFSNPTVEPGKVKWHDDYDAACAASRKSGKPVLLFQMMGNLDDRFC